MKVILASVFLAVALFARSTNVADATDLIDVDCGDGAPISGSVDLPTFTQLGASLQAMNDFPSGMSCALRQSALLDPLHPGGDPGDFAVGGGQYGHEYECSLNFSFSAHVDKVGAHGTVNATTTPNYPLCSTQGHIKVNVTCLAVDGNAAQIRGDVKEASGYFLEFFPTGEGVLVTDVIDNGKPSGDVPDRIVQYVGDPGSELLCVPPVADPFFTVNNGNISVHDR